MLLTPMQNLPFQPILWGGQPHDFTEQTAGGVHALNLGVYTNETTKRYICGTRSMTWDGRVFRYARCGEYAITTNKFGVANWTALIANKVENAGANQVVMTDASVGDTNITVTFTQNTLGNIEAKVFGEKNGVLGEHDLCGGYISLYTGDYRQQRGIIGNTAVATGGTSMIIYLDAPLDHVLTAGGSFCEILSNPYGHVGRTTDERTSIVGMPNVIAAIKDYLWLQTWGVLRISGVNLELGQPTRQRQFIFDWQGAVQAASTFAASDSAQYAGFLIERTESSTAQYSAAPFIMLQISP